MAFVQIKDMPRMAQYLDLYCRSPEFTVMPPGKYQAGGLQSGCTANSTGAQYKCREKSRLQALWTAGFERKGIDYE